MAAMCKECGDTGLLPFVKDDRVIPNAWVHCNCYHEKAHYKKLPPPDNPDMFDYPMSDLFRGYSYQYCNQVDPRDTPEPQPESLPDGDYRLTHVHIHRYSYVRKEDDHY